MWYNFIKINFIKKYFNKNGTDIWNFEDGKRLIILNNRRNAMERFIGRADELRKLNELYETEGFHMAVVYDRRRIGKSTLLTKFVQD